MMDKKKIDNIPIINYVDDTNQSVKDITNKVDDLKKSIPQYILNAYFESELMLRYGLTLNDLNNQYGIKRNQEVQEIEGEQFFPTCHIDNWEALRKNTDAMHLYANSVQYREKMRSIRISNRPKEARDYLASMYYCGDERCNEFACQLCHESILDFEATEVFLQPEKELAPLHLCLCPNCAVIYRRLRTYSGTTINMRKAFLFMKDIDIENSNYVAISISKNKELWFTQLHFAEIRELLKQKEEYKTDILESVDPLTDISSAKSDTEIISVFDKSGEINEQESNISIISENDQVDSMDKQSNIIMYNSIDYINRTRTNGYKWVKEGTKVFHNAWGNGVIEEIDKDHNHISVRFGSDVRMFRFPDSLVNGYLLSEEELEKINKKENGFSIIIDEMKLLFHDYLITKQNYHEDTAESYIITVEEVGDDLRRRGYIDIPIFAVRDSSKIEKAFYIINKRENYVKKRRNYNIYINIAMNNYIKFLSQLENSPEHQ